MPTGHGKAKDKKATGKSGNSRKRLNKANVFKQCSFLNAKKEPCRSPVCDEHPELGLYFCGMHRKMYFKQDIAWLMEAEAIQQDMVEAARKRGIKINSTIDNARRTVADRKEESCRIVAKAEKTLALSQPEDLLDKEVKETAGRVRWKKTGNLYGDGTTGKHVQVIDVEYYTPDYNDEHWFQLCSAIRRAEAKVNLLYSLLGEVQGQKTEIETVTSEGVMPIGTRWGVEEGRVANRTRKPLSYYEAQLKIHDSIDKAEAHLGKLMKQREETVLNALLTMRQFGIVFSPEAGRMVLNAAKKIEEGPMDEYHKLVRTQQEKNPEVLDAIMDFPTLHAHEEDL